MEQKGKRNRLVAFYTQHGSTGAAARMLAQKLGSEIYEIQDPTRRKGLIGFMRSGFQAAFKKRVRIAPIPPDLAREADEILLAAPLWASMPAPAINSFLDHAPLQGKTVHIITVQADPGHVRSEKASGYLKSLIESRGGSVQQIFALTGASPGKKPDPEQIRPQVEEVINTLAAGQ
ncbi:MAG TPA: hypothetical protein DD727_05740 [Clostridiales bacterium]|nr:hypothetical protein [Clostridiales bacterium]